MTAPVGLPAPGTAPVDLIAAGPAHGAVISAMHRVFFTDWWDEPAVAEVLAMPGAYGFVAVTGDCQPAGMPAGMILCRTAADEAEVLTLGVVPPQRRRGVGGALLTAAGEVARARGARMMYLEVADGNHGGLALYTAQDFAVVGRRPRYYADGGDALILRREL